MSISKSSVRFSIIGSFEQPLEYFYFSLILWACYMFAEQQTMATLMIVKDHLLAAIFNIYIVCVCLCLSSGILRCAPQFLRKPGGLSFNLNCRSIKGLQDWLFSLTYATQARYAAAFLVRQLFLHPNLSKPLPYDNKVNCTNMNSIETSVLNGFTNPYCRYTAKFV